MVVAGRTPAVDVARGTPVVAADDGAPGGGAARGGTALPGARLMGAAFGCSSSPK